MKYSDELKNKIRELVRLRPRNFGQCCESASYHQLGIEIRNAVPLLKSDEYTYATRIYWILNDMFDFPICEICGAKITRNIRTLQLGYVKAKGRALTCSCKCSKIVQLKHMKQTCINRYGVENPYAVECVKDKIRQHNIETYGVEIAGNRPEGRKKAKQTLIKNYGEEGLKSQIIRDRKVKKSLEHYGVHHYAQSSQCKELQHRRAVLALIDKLKADPELEFVDINDLKIDMTFDEIRHTKFNLKCKKCGKHMQIN